MDGEGFGELLRRARAAKGLSAERVAKELNLPPQVLLQLESEQWDSLPAGQARPLARQMARRLDLDLEACREAFEHLPGGQDPDAVDPRAERVERAVMAVLAAGCVVLVAWLVKPGRDLRQGAVPTRGPSRISPPPEHRSGPKEGQAFPVLGEVLPEAPRTEEGSLISIRVLDACKATLLGEGGERVRDLRVSEPWLLRVKGAFTLSLDNAGVATVEVGGRRIRHGHSVGETWTGRFGADGQWLRAAPPVPEAATGPETEGAVPEGKE
jgi:transcriptional regulator with XRE-family HTH domain